MAREYSPAVEAVWTAYPKKRGVSGNKGDFANKWEKLGLTDGDRERVLTLLAEQPPTDEYTGAAWLGMVIAGETPRARRQRATDRADGAETQTTETAEQTVEQVVTASEAEQQTAETDTAAMAEQPKTEQTEQAAPRHPGGRPRKPGQTRLSVSIPETTMRQLRLLAAVQDVTVPQLIERMAADAMRKMPGLGEYV